MVSDPSSQPEPLRGTGLRPGLPVRRWLAWLGDALYPGRCGLCLAPGGAVCAGCLGDLPVLENPCPTCAMPLPAAGVCPDCIRRPPELDGLRAGWAYAWPLDQLILAYKHGASTAAERVLTQLAGHLAGKLSGAAAPRPDLVLPVPLHERRLRERGFNQAEQLARQVASVLGVPLATRMLRRTRPTDSQQGLGRKARHRNVQGAFVWNGDPLAGQQVLVVDDVATTGATLTALAGVLRAAGAVRVEGLVLARA